MQRSRPDGVRMAWVGEQRRGRALLDEPSGVEHADPLAHPADHAEVVADEQDARAELLAQAGDQIEHLRLHRRVETRRRLVEDQQRRVLGQRHRDHDPLLHATGELMRIAAHDPGRIRDLHLREHRARPIEGLVLAGAEDREHLGDLLADADRRVQRRAGVLVDHREGAWRGGAARRSLLIPKQVLAVDANRSCDHPAVARQVAHDREGRRRLPAAGLADEPVRLALADRRA